MGQKQLAPMRTALSQKFLTAVSHGVGCFVETSGKKMADIESATTTGDKNEDVISGVRLACDHLFQQGRQLSCFSQALSSVGQF